MLKVPQVTSYLTEHFGDDAYVSLTIRFTPTLITASVAKDAP